MKEYLIAYIASNGRILTEKIFAENQKDAIKKFNLYNYLDEIIAITEIEK